MSFTDTSHLEDNRPLNLGELYTPAMSIKDQADADNYFAKLCQYFERTVDSEYKGNILTTVRSNLGYWAGYFDSETQKRVEELFHAVHPAFGEYVNEENRREKAEEKFKELTNKDNNEE